MVTNAGTLTVDTSPACSVILYVTFLTVFTEHSTSCPLCSHGLSRSLHGCSTYMQGGHMYCTSGCSPPKASHEFSVIQSIDCLELESCMLMCALLKYISSLSVSVYFFMTRTVLPNCGYNHQHVRLAWFSTSTFISALESFVVGPCCLYSRCE